MEDSNNPNRVQSTVDGFDSLCEVEEQPQVAHVV
jgi:hypothetical protein